MAQTKRKRRSKHRGNAAGSVEVRGRTGRQVAPAKGGKAVRLDRLDRPPTRRSAAKRSAIATLLFVVVITFLQHNLASALVIGLLMFPLYTDKRIYEKRKAKKAAGKL